MSGAGLRLLRFFFLKRIIIRVVSLREQLFQTVRRLAGNILNGDALADVGGVVRMALRGVNVQIPDELVRICVRTNNYLRFLVCPKRKSKL